MQYTVIGVWLADKPVVTGVVTGATTRSTAATRHGRRHAIRAAPASPTRHARNNRTAGRRTATTAAVTVKTFAASTAGACLNRFRPPGLGDTTLRVASPPKRPG